MDKEIIGILGCIGLLIGVVVFVAVACEYSKFKCREQMQGRPAIELKLVCG